MPKFRRKPVVIEAEQWFPPGDSQYREGLFEILPAPRGPREPGKVYCVGKRLYQFETTHTPVQLFPGDWIIKGPSGYMWVCAPDTFAEDYEWAD